MIQFRKGQYHLIKVHVTASSYIKSVAKAIRGEYSRYRGYLWSLLSYRVIGGVDYVKVSPTMRPLNLSLKLISTALTTKN